MIRKDGTTRWFLARGQIVRDAGGGSTHMIGADTDITLLKHVEEMLQQREAQLRQIIDLVPHMIFAKDEAGRFVLVNQATADAYGTTVEKLLGVRQPDVHSQEGELQRMLGDDREVIRSGKRKHIPEEIFVGASGKRSVL